MALTVKKDRSVLFPVTMTLRNEDGDVVEMGFKVKYLPLSRSEYQVKMRETGAIVGSDDEKGDFSLRDYIRKNFGEEEVKAHDAWLKSRVLGWADIKDEEGNDIPFTDENYTALMEDMAIAAAIDGGLLKCSAETPVKN